MNDNKGNLPERPKISYERYRTVLIHEFVDNDGKCIPIDPPLSVQYSIMRGENFGVPTCLLLNEMMDKLKMALIENAERNGI